MTSKIQNALILLGIIAIAGVGYYLYTQNKNISPQNKEVNNQDAVETSNFLQRLNTIKSIKLKGDILNDPRFTSLTDSSVPVLEVPSGRENPFAPHN